MCDCVEIRNAHEFNQALLDNEYPDESQGLSGNDGAEVSCRTYESRLVVAAHQELTAKWWNPHRQPV